MFLEEFMLGDQRVMTIHLFLVRDKWFLATPITLLGVNPIDSKLEKLYRDVLFEFHLKFWNTNSGSILKFKVEFK